MRKLLKLIAIVVLAATGQASYADVTFNLDTVINGSTPSGGADWLTATFADNGTGNVMLTLSNNMGPGLYISDLLFNSSDPISSFTLPSQVLFTQTPLVASDFVDPLSPIAAPGLEAGLFNVHVGFKTSQFTNGTLSLDIAGGTSLTENSFNVLSAPGGDGYTGTTYFIAALVQGFSDGSSGSIGYTNVSAVPEPEIYVMMGVGLLLMGFLARGKREPLPHAMT